MNKVLLDTNVLLDVMLDDRPGANAAAAILRLVESGNVVGIVSASSLKDIYYVSRKYLKEKLARSWVRFFMDAFAVAPVDKTACAIALDSNEPDFEDGIIRAVAELEGADFILTRDAAAFKDSTIRPVDTKTYLELFAS